MKDNDVKRYPKGTYPNMKAECAKPFRFAHFVTRINSQETSIKFLQVSVRACSVKLSTCGFYLLEQVPPFLPTPAFPKATAQRGTNGPQGGNWVWIWEHSFTVSAILG